MTPTTAERSGLDIDLKGVSKSFGGNPRVVSDVDLSIRAGDFVTLLGPSGSGKTTTLNMIAGLENVTSGDITFDGKSINRTPAHKRNLGMLFQNYALFPHMTVGQNVEYPLKERKVPAAQRKALVDEFLELVQLGAKRDMHPQQLSGGQQQRVALARSIVFSPRALLLDEPLSALDKNLRGSLQLELRRIHREVGSTFVFVTHDQEEAMTLSDTIVLFREGGVAQVGDPETMYRRPSSLFAAQFLGESNVFDVDVDRRLVTYGDTQWDVSPEDFATEQDFTGQAHLVVRPEHTSLHPSGPSASWPGVRVRIVDVEYLGSSVRIVCREGGDGRLLIHRSHAEGADLPVVGDDVWLSWDARQQRVVPE